MVAGDVAHTKTNIAPQYVDMASEFFINLSKIAPVHVIVGNHDANLANNQRLDALSPIISLIQSNTVHPVTLYTNSGLYRLNHEHSLFVYSLLDKQSYLIQQVERSNDVTISMYHGMTKNCHTNVGYTFKQAPDMVWLLQKYSDYGFFGDIHQAQILSNNKFRYCGSLIQQDFGESEDKGYMLWDIYDKDKFDVKFIKLQNEHKFVTADVLDDNIPQVDIQSQNMNLRLRFPSQTKKQEINKMLSNFKSKCNVTFIKKKQQSSEVKLEQGDVSQLHDRNFLLKQYFKKKGQQIDQIQLIKLDQVISSELKDNYYDKKHRVFWTLFKLQFDNLFKYGGGNVVDFQNLAGVNGVFGANRTGKSSFLGTIPVAIWGRSPKSDNVRDIVNDKCTEAKSAIELKTNIGYFRIQRQFQYLVKLGNKNPRKTSSVQILFKKSINDQWINQTRIDKPQTEKYIQSRFGKYQTFMISAFAAQRKIQNFIDIKQRQRVDVLIKYFGYDVFSKLYQIANQKRKELRTIINSMQTNLTEDIEQIQEQIQHITNQLIILDDLKNNQYNTVTESDSKIKQLYLSLTPIDSSYYVGLQQSLIQKKKTYQAQIENKQTTLDDLQKLDLILKKQIATQLELKCKKIQKIKIKAERDSQNISKNICKYQSIEQHDVCNSCLMMIDFKNSQNDKVRAQKAISAADKVLVDLNSELSQIKKNNQRYKTRQKLRQQISYLKQLKESADFKINYMNQNKQQISKNAQIKQEIERSQSNHKCSKKQLQKYQSDIKINEIQKRKLQNKITEINKNSATLKEHKKRFDLLQNYCEAVNFEGIPKRIINYLLPKFEDKINQFISHIDNFKIRFKLDDQLKILIDDRFIQTGSGMQQLIFSFAFRMRLAKYQYADCFVVDQSFSPLDAENQIKAGMICKTISQYFSHIFMVSHIQSLKDFVDNVIEIKNIDDKAKIVV